MTDGIIQQVFKPYSVMNENIVWLLDRIEQELIEKIKQEYNNPKILWSDNTFQFYQKLIGDNQE